MRLFISLIILSFISCQNTNIVEIEVEQSIEEIITEETSVSNFEELDNHYSHEIMFKDFKVIIDSIYVWEEYKIKAPITDDSAFATIELGETIEHKNISIIQDEFDVVTIYQRFENSITIMNEGPHCDMIDWKHYNSEWKLLDYKNGVFISDSYSDEDWGKFLPINMDDLAQAVEDKCGERWSKLITSINNPNQYPSGISMSRVFLKIELENTSLNTKQEKIIVFKIPMGS